MKPIKRQFHHRHLLFKIVFFSFILLNVLTNINQCFPPLDFPSSRLKRSIFLKRYRLTKELEKAISSNNSQMPQDLMSATFLNRILKNGTEKTVQTRLKRSIEGDVNPVK